MVSSQFKKLFLMLRWLLVVVVLTTVLLELSLQLASLFVEKREQQSSWLHPGRIRVITLGDSNTYGLYLQAEQAYPAIFERQWNMHHPDKPIEVINLGFPGTNSSRVLKSLPDVIRTFSPDVITVMVGVNDFWMAPVDVKAVASPVTPLQGWLRDHSRAYKLVYLLKRQAYNSSLLKIDDEYRNAKFDSSRLPEWKAAISGQAKLPMSDKPAAVHYGNTVFDIGYVFDISRKQNLSGDMNENLARIADIAKQSNVKIIFISYAYYEMPQKAANQQMQVVGKEKNVDFFNVKVKFRKECALGEDRCRELFFPDYHPSASGHQLLADEIETRMSKLLR